MKARVDMDDVMEQARAIQGLERLDQIKYAVLERGGVSVILKPAEQNASIDEGRTPRYRPFW